LQDWLADEGRFLTTCGLMKSRKGARGFGLIPATTERWILVPSLCVAGRLKPKARDWAKYLRAACHSLLR
jgi:hypothetical protein